MFDEEIPSDSLERIKMLEGILVERATGGSPQQSDYEIVRRLVLTDPRLQTRIPDFVRIYRNLNAFWPFIQEKFPSYAERRSFIHTAFRDVIDYLEFSQSHPSDSHSGDIFANFDLQSVSYVWEKALARRSSDPEGAITVARTLLEETFKRVLVERGKEFGRSDDLPKLYKRVATELNLAPEAHSEVALKAILQGAVGVVNGLGTLRNALSDAHGRGDPQPVRPSARHASLAVNIAGSVAAFVAETHMAKTKE